MNLILTCIGIFIVLLIIFLYSIGIFNATVSTKPAAVSAVFGLILAIIIVKKSISLRDPSPLLVLNTDGIITKVTAVGKAAGLILWKDIIEVNIDKVGGDTLITLTIDKPQDYLPLIKKKLSAMAVDGIEDAQGNLSIHLTASELDLDAQELFTVITKYRSKINDIEHEEMLNNIRT